MIDLETHEARMAIEAVWHSRSRLNKTGWAKSSIQSLLSKLGRRYGPTDFSEDYPEIIKYIEED